MEGIGHPFPPAFQIPSMFNRDLIFAEFVRKMTQHGPDEFETVKHKVFDEECESELEKCMCLKPGGE